MSDSVIDAFPSDTALSKQLQQGMRWRQAESEKDQPFRGNMWQKAVFSEDWGYLVHLKRDGSSISQGCSSRPLW